MGSRRRGFTLIELLVVIAIIGILAAMVFPVFARARESARKTVCLSNVKNIALAVQMYLADNNDVLPPREHDASVQAWFDAYGGPDCWEMPSLANPYLRWAVLLDEYVKNRDVWRCPSAKMEATPLFIWGAPSWFGELKAQEGAWGGDTGLCPYIAFPNGWGGGVTDSIAQGVGPGGSYGSGGLKTTRVFVQSINCNEAVGMDKKLAAVQDPVTFVICGDGCPELGNMKPGNTAYPDICAVECAYCQVMPQGQGWAGGGEMWDWETCAADLASGCSPIFAPPAFLIDPNLRKPYARHLGGTNMGFLDGHASWWNSEKLLAAVAAEGPMQDPMGLWWRGGPANSLCVVQGTGGHYPTLW